MARTPRHDDNNPLDDPEVKAKMKAMGVVHRPGSADAVMKEVAPYLAADGFDINDPANFDDLEKFNEAMQRAMEKRNLDLATATGEPLAWALAMLRVFSVAVAEESWSLCETLIDSIPPEPDDPQHASVAQVIGTSLTLLDTWHTDPAFRPVMARAKIPRWSPQAGKAARDCLALASKGRAFSSLKALIIRHRGYTLLEGTCFAVAASVIAWAEHTGTTVTAVSSELMGEPDETLDQEESDSASL